MIVNRNIKINIGKLLRLRKGVERSRFDLEREKTFCLKKGEGKRQELRTDKLRERAALAS